MAKAVVKVAISALVFSLVALEAQAGTGCIPSLSVPLQDAERTVSSIRFDKPGQARVFAADGSEYTAGAARWMSAELSIAGRACTRGDEATAVQHLDAVRKVLKTH